jgi:hypothetical protein
MSTGQGTSRYRHAAPSIREENPSKSSLGNDAVPPPHRPLVVERNGLLGVANLETTLEPRLAALGLGLHALQFLAGKSHALGSKGETLARQFG